MAYDFEIHDTLKHRTKDNMKCVRFFGVHSQIGWVLEEKVKNYESFKGYYIEQKIKKNDMKDFELSMLVCLA